MSFFFVFDLATDTKFTCYVTEKEMPLHLSTRYTITHCTQSHKIHYCTTKPCSFPLVIFELHSSTTLGFIEFFWVQTEGKQMFRILHVVPNAGWICSERCSSASSPPRKNWYTALYYPFTIVTI